MNLDSEGPLLKKMKINKIETDLHKEILEFVEEFGQERTVRSSSSLHFLYKIYQAEKIKEKRSKKRLKKAEELIMKLTSLHYEAQQREMERKKRENRESPFKWTGSAIPVSKRMKELFESIGITDEKAMEQIVELLGEKKVGERIDLVHASNLGEGLVKKLFRMKPEMLLAVKDDEFISMVETLERKKELIDIWGSARELIPSDTAYIRIPEILFEEYHEISRILELKPIEREEPTEVEEKRQKVRVTPIHPDDFVKVLRRMGFEMKGTNPHRVFAHPDGRTALVQYAHKGLDMFGPGLIRMKLKDIGMPIEEFERVRKELGL